jgi:transcriptional regulator with XRE-family HTH domain
MTSGAQVLKNILRARGIHLEELSRRTGTGSRHYSAGYLGKVLRGERRLTDEVFDSIAGALELSDEERTQVLTARDGTGAVDVTQMIAISERRVMDRLEQLSGELRSSTNLILDRLDRPRGSPRP